MKPPAPKPRVALTHRGSIEIVGTHLADDVAEPGAVIRYSECAARVFAELIGGEDREHVAVLMLNGGHRVVGASIVSIGTVNFAPIHPREFFKAAILQNAAAVICGHNHPSGELVPSTADKTIAAALRDAGQLLQVPLLDFLIVAGSRHLSFLEAGVMDFEPTKLMEIASSHEADAHSNRVDSAARADHKPSQADLDEELEEEEEEEQEQSR